MIGGDKAHVKILWKVILVDVFFGEFKILVHLHISFLGEQRVSLVVTENYRVLEVGSDIVAVGYVGIDHRIGHFRCLGAYHGVYGAFDEIYLLIVLKAAHYVGASHYGVRYLLGNLVGFVFLGIIFINEVKNNDRRQNT